MDVIAPSRVEGRTHIENVDYFDPDDTLITTLKRAIANSQDLLLEQDIGSVLVLSSRGEYFSRTSDERSFFSSSVSETRISILSKGDRRLPSPDTIGRNIDELMWKAAFHVSEGRLLRGCHPVDMVAMSTWPNLSRIPHTPNTPRIIALLTRHPTSIILAARVLKIAPAEIYQFYSAARCAGLAQPVNCSQEEPHLKPHRNQTLLSTLLEKLSKL